MTYTINTPSKNTGAEAELPQGKRILFRSFFILPLLVFLFFCNQSIAAKIDFDKKLRGYLQEEINSYLSQIGSDKQKQKIELFIPKGSSALTCDNVMISRSKESSPPAGRISLSVKCKSPKWRFRASAKINLWINLVAATRNLNRGELLTKDLLEYKSADISLNLHSAEASIAPLVGMAVKRDMRKGDIISRRYLETRHLVNKDEFVLLQINMSNFSANVKAVALQDGQLGEIINVKNLSSNKIVQGKVIDTRVVEAIY